MHRSHKYRVAGFVLESDFPIGELAPIDPRQNIADVRIKMAPAPEAVESPQLVLSWIQANSSECRLNIPSIGRFYIKDGVEVLVQPEAETAVDDLNPYLLGIVLGVICHQRKLLALHANAVEVEDGCVAFVGPSGAGKSTLTGFLNERGYRMVTDDVCLIRFDDEYATVSPTAPRLKLWKNTLEALGRSSTELKPVLTRLNKFSLPVSHANDVLRLNRVYVLAEPSPEWPDGISRISGAEAIKSLVDNLYYPEIGWATRGESIFTQSRRLLNTVECYRLSRPLGFNVMGSVIDRLEKHFFVGND